MDTIIKQIPALGRELRYKLNHLSKDLKDISPEHENIIYRIFFLKKNIKQIFEDLNNIEIEIKKNNKHISDNLLEKINDEQEYQKMLDVFMPAMLLYQMNNTNL